MVMSFPCLINSAFPNFIDSFLVNLWFSPPLGYLINIGPLKFTANSNMFFNSSKSFGAITVRFGIDDRNDKSNIPWWVSPSFPTIPALSIQITTGNFWSAMSWTNWSYPLCKNDEYIASTGFKPSFAIPAIIPIACCSAIPTSKNLSGNFSEKLFKPVPSFIAAVTATIFSFFSASSTNFSPNTLE